MKLKNMILAALFTALTIAGTFLKIPMVPVAITLQTLFTLAAGVLLGPAVGAVSQVLYVLLGLVGLPVFTGGGGFGYIFSPTFGYLIALPVAAWTAGMLTRRGKTFVRVLLACAVSSLIVYAVGVPYMLAIVNLHLGGSMDVPSALWSGMALFLPGDALKCLAVAAVSPRIAKYSR